MLRLADLVACDWEYAFGKELVPLEEIKKRMEKADGLIKFKQRYSYAEAETLQKLQAAMAQGEKLTPAQILQAALEG